MRRLAVLLSVALTAACAGTVQGDNLGHRAPAFPGGGIGAEGMQRVSEQALVKWKDFPAEAKPRPIVLTGGSAVKVQKGFATGEAKLAFSMGLIEPDGKLPASGPATVKVDGSDFPALSPTDAFAKLKLAEGGKSEPVPAPIKVVSVKLDTDTFLTDRGSRELPAWVFELTDTLGPISVLAFTPEWVSTSIGFDNNRVSADGLTLTVILPAAPAPCPGDSQISYSAEVLESPTAVAVGLRVDNPQVQLGSCARDMMLRTAEYRVKLAKPLGGRVLVDTQGMVMAVSL